MKMNIEFSTHGAVGENQCEHKDAPHHARGLCRPCYIALRRATM
jgi:hypothetical protein